MTMQQKYKNIWDSFHQYLEQQNNICCIVKNLSQKNDNPIYVSKICDSNLLRNYFKDNFISNDLPYLDPKSKIFIAVIPKGSQTFINLFCCKMTMENIHSKISDYGMALEGCFNIEPITMLPLLYQGYDYSSVTKNITPILKNPRDIKDFELITTSSQEIITEQAFLVIDNHTNISIIDGQQFLAYKPKGINVQYVEGKRLFRDGNPIIDLDLIKNVIVKNASGLSREISGSHVNIDYDHLKIIINGNNIFNFSDIGNKINFVNQDFFEMNGGALVFGTDKNNNLFIIYHRHIDFYNMILLLKAFDCNDAILLCNKSDANIIWKESGSNTYNKTDFIGNPKKILSNIITFSG